MPAKGSPRKRAAATKPAATKPEPTASGQLVLALEWKVPDDLPNLHANQLFISHAGGEFYLVFGEVVPPILSDPGKVPDHLEVKAVARLSISPAAMVRMTEVIAKNVGRAVEQFGSADLTDSGEQ